MLQVGTIFDSRYEFIRLLGRGGFSEVWLANDSYTNLDVAIKIYAPGQGMEADGLVEFSAELAKVFNLNHVNLLKPSHVDTWEGMPYLIMPYCSHGSITKEVGKMKEPEIWRLIRDVACGLAYLHEHDIVHQDIKPDNILLDDNGNYVITDFGISAKARSTLRKSVIGGVVSGGTMAYMGPERFSKNPTPTKASDIWSFGAMVYELLTGEVPFGELGGGLQRGGADVPEIKEPISEALLQTINKMLFNNPEDRPTANQLLHLSNETLVLKDGDQSIQNNKTNDKKNASYLLRPILLILCFICVVGLFLIDIYVRFSHQDENNDMNVTEVVVDSDIIKNRVFISNNRPTKIEPIEIEMPIQKNDGNRKDSIQLNINRSPKQPIKPNTETIYVHVRDTITAPSPSQLEEAKRKVERYYRMRRIMSLRDTSHNWELDSTEIAIRLSRLREELESYDSLLEEETKQATPTFGIR